MPSTLETQSIDKFEEATMSPLAGKPAPKEMLVDVGRLERDYFDRHPDLHDPNQLVSFGTSGHRGSPLHGPPIRSTCPRHKSSSLSCLIRSRSVAISWNLTLELPALMTRTFIDSLHSSQHEALLRLDPLLTGAVRITRRSSALIVRRVHRKPADRATSQQHRPAGACRYG